MVKCYEGEKERIKDRSVGLNTKKGSKQRKKTPWSAQGLLIIHSYNKISETEN